jgi:predicted ATPase
MSNAKESYRRGSEWRKWDLHVHTPFSALNNGFGQEFDSYASEVLRKAVDLRIAAIGLTDYFLIDGYTRMRELLSDEDRLIALLGDDIAQQARRIALFPNIELRSSVLIANEGDTARVNFHVLFDPAIEPSVIEDHFLREIQFTAQAAPSSSDESWSLTRANLVDLGRLLKAEHDKFASQSDLAVGMTNAVVHHEDVTESLQRQPSRFANRYLFVVPADEDLSKIGWDGQGHQTRKLFLQKADMFFSANPGTRDFGLGQRHPSVEAFVSEFGGLKPCIHGSDAHTYDELFEPALKRYLWIKSDPTFQGLRQLLFEPGTRVYIGPEPTALSRAREKATRYMDQISFEKTEKSKDETEWFSGSLPLNHGLVAIIGNKGGGKSALSDILALLGETRSSDHFSFLSAARFLSPKGGLGEMFIAKVLWLSGQERERVLTDPVDLTVPELVKYIPQGFLEAICTELQESPETQFDRELMEVIFSHVGRADRLGRETLSELIVYITKETEELVDQLNLRLIQVNGEILDLESQQTDEHRKTLLAQLAQRRADLEAHVSARPPDVAEPEADPEVKEKTSATKEELDKLVQEIEDLDKKIADTNERLRLSALKIASADRLLDRLTNFERQLDAFHLDSVRDAEILELDTHSIVHMSIDRETVDTLRTNAVADNEAAKALLSTKEGGLPFQREESSKGAETAREELDEPTRRYQEHLRRLAGWDKEREEIEGSAQVTGSMLWLEAKLEALNALPTLVVERQAQRLAIVEEIFEAKLRLLEKYRALYAPVQEFIDTHPVAQQQATLQFSASIGGDEFADTFLNMIHQGRRGSFQGDPEGREQLETLLAIADFSTFTGTRAFLKEMEEHLIRDKREGGADAPVRVEDQLRQDYSPDDVYDLLYGLSYLVPRFELLWQGKPIDKLSPGERGSLLLIFYLLIDRRDVPLIIDQPEENLDNHTIATALIPALKHAKERRQIVIVTHNPNLAVVCDAEQIIHAQIDKTAGNRVEYTAGGIEDPDIARLVVDVLEGTKPLFDIRGAKYEVLERLV